MGAHSEVGDYLWIYSTASGVILKSQEGGLLVKNYFTTPLINATVIDHTHFIVISAVCECRGVTTLI